MTLIRKNRNYFIGTDLPRGTAYKRFRALNKPDENTFMRVFESILMPNEVDDTATINFSGHSRVAVDNDVIIRKDSYDDGHTRFVKPNQIPSGNMSITNENLTYKLINDETAPDGNKYYGTNSAGEKGFHQIASGTKQFIDIQKSGCDTRHYSGLTPFIEKQFVISKNDIANNTRIVWTTYFCVSTYNISTLVSFGILAATSPNYSQLTSLWGSADDARTLVGTSVDPYTTLMKVSVVIDVVDNKYYINCYNEYHNHANGQYLPGRSCCYSGGPTDYVNTTDLVLRLSHVIPNSGNTFSYGRSEVTIYNTEPLNTIV